MHLRKILWLVYLSNLLGIVACEKDFSISNQKSNTTTSDYAVCKKEHSISDPAWSPDGKKIAFISRSMLTTIYKDNVSGVGQSPEDRICMNILDGDLFAVSPDGKFILYRAEDWQSTDFKYNFFIYNTEIESSQLFDAPLPAYPLYVQWSRDNQYLFYVTRVNKQYTLHAISQVGTQVFSVTLDSTFHLDNFSVTSDLQSIVWSGQTQQYQNYQIWQYTTASGQHKLLAADSANLKKPCLSPDGNNLVYYNIDKKTDKTCLNIYSFLDGSIRVFADNKDYYHLSDVYPIEWSKDGQYIYFCGYTPSPFLSKTKLIIDNVWQLSLKDNSIITLNSFLGFVDGIDMNGSLYLQETDDIYCLHAYSVDDKKLACLLRGDTEEIAHPTWSPDGASLVFSKNRKLYKMSANGGEPESLSINDPYLQNNPAFSPDGSLLVFDNYQYIYTCSLKNGQVKQLQSDFSGLSNPALSPDGKQIACSSYNYINEQDSLIVFNFSNDELEFYKSWPGHYTGISWSKQHPDYGSLIMCTELTPSHSYGSLSQFKVINPYNGQFIHPNDFFSPFNVCRAGTALACWSPDAESIAWTQYDGRYSDTYSLNIARIFEDLH